VPQDRNSALTARSVVLSTLLGTRPPVLPVRVLVRAGDLFGIGEGALRVALSRMVASGELEATDGSYRLAGRLLDRQARQELSREARTREWHGGWRFALVTAERRDAAARADLRDAMRTLRMAELREGVWLRPDNLAGVGGDGAAAAVVDAQCLWVDGTLDPGTHAGELVARLWDPEGWADEAEALRRRLWSTEPAADTLAAGFVLSAAVLRHFQADPLLPPELLPAHWPGPALRTDYAGWDERYRRALRDFLRA